MVLGTEEPPEKGIKMMITGITVHSPYRISSRHVYRTEIDVHVGSSGYWRIDAEHENVNRCVQHALEAVAEQIKLALLEEGS